jgi:UDP-N-acetylglucosamine 2-epimerase
MRRRKVLTVVGARPQFIKAAAALLAREIADAGRGNSGGLAAEKVPQSG